MYASHKNRKEREGFEPSEPLDSSDFKSDAIDQLCHLSNKVNGSKFANQTF